MARETLPTIVHDLDVISSADIGFKYHGKIYKIERLTMDAYIQLIPVYAKVSELQKQLLTGGSVDTATVINEYYKITSTLIPELPFAELKSMEFAELNTVLDLLSRKISGDPTITKDALKKKLQTQRLASRKKLFSSFSRGWHSFATFFRGRTKTS